MRFVSTNGATADSAVWADDHSTDGLPAIRVESRLG